MRPYCMTSGDDDRAFARRTHWSGSGAVSSALDCPPDGCAPGAPRQPSATTASTTTQRSEGRAADALLGRASAAAATTTQLIGRCGVIARFAERNGGDPIPFADSLKRGSCARGPRWSRNARDGTAGQPPEADGAAHGAGRADPGDLPRAERDEPLLLLAHVAARVRLQVRGRGGDRPSDRRRQGEGVAAHVPERDP